MDSHLWAFFAGAVVGASGVFLALWFDVGMDWLERTLR
jgi:hypothetical protein